MKIQYSSIKFWKWFKIKNIVAIILFCGFINSLNSVRDKCDIDYFFKMFHDINKTMHLAMNNQYTQLFPTQILFVFLFTVPPAQFWKWYFQLPYTLYPTYLKYLYFLLLCALLTWFCIWTLFSFSSSNARCKWKVGLSSCFKSGSPF